jgi:hypothetical protein
MSFLINGFIKNRNNFAFLLSVNINPRPVTDKIAFFLLLIPIFAKANNQPSLQREAVIISFNILYMLSKN